MVSSCLYNMAFKKKIMLLLALGVLVVMVQMAALNILSSQPLAQLEVPGHNKKKRDGHHNPGTTTPALEQENPQGSQVIKDPLPHTPRKMDQSDNSRLGQRSHQQQQQQHAHGVESRDLKQVPGTEAAVASTKRSPKSDAAVLSVTEESSSFSPFPAKEVWNCDISDSKDAMSAISRAKTQQCKELIHNISCLSKAGKLYDTNIKNSCPIGRNAGRGVESIPPQGVSEGSPPVRVVFLLSVHGRAFRQVKRLFKAIYHSDHYYFIHVDSRSDYLHRKLYEEVSDFPNVYFPTWRMATIWGGASLLQMLLRALQDLEYVLTDWKWDYFINLSESDYPVKTNEELVKFLRAHYGKNFVKTHGGELNKFIQKQGLDRTFVECDNHMWRVDKRTLPHDINVDGGSDWIVIHRNYSHYLVTNKDPFLTNLKRYYEFSLLPAESFFHTVIRNGPLCETFVKSNLRITNWNRRLGCRCQYKDIVDWCGCSPNDFLGKDISRLKNPGNHHFFARKFEAIVSQEIVRLLDDELYGSLPSDLPGLTSYWESVYHLDDELTKSSNARYSTYQSFLRSTTRHIESERKSNHGDECGVPKNPTVSEVSVFMKDDKFRGLVVILKDSLSEESMNPPIFEVLFTPISHYKRFTFDGELNRRIWSMEVGSNWDGKESIFRNYGGVLGVWDEPCVAIRLSTSGPQGDVNIIWNDPVGVRISTASVKLDASWFVSYHKPKLERPIRPGVWSVQLEMQHGALLMQTTFLVVPLTHENKVSLESPQIHNAQRLRKSGVNFNREKFDMWNWNVTKSGLELDGWLDELVAQYWTIESVCRTEMEHDDNGGDTRQCNSWLPDCCYMKWSTFSSDPKSEIGEVEPNGRIR